jgi:hypothetical protein
MGKNTVLRWAEGCATPEQITVYASCRLTWQDLSWDGEAIDGPDGPGVCSNFRDAPKEEDRAWPTGTPREAVDALRAEAERLLLLYGTPVGGYRIVVPDGDGRKLERAERVARRVDDLLFLVLRVAAHLPEELEMPIRGWVARTWSRRATRERTY